MNDFESCRYTKRKKVAGVKGFVELPEGNEKELEEAIRKIGPISAGIQASFFSMQSYSTGIYFEPRCDPEQVNRELKQKLLKGKLIRIFPMKFQTQCW